VIVTSTPGVVDFIKPFWPNVNEFKIVIDT
jgi:hypothetical protein